MNSKEQELFDAQSKTIDLLTNRLAQVEEQRDALRRALDQAGDRIIQMRQLAGKKLEAIENGN